MDIKISVVIPMYNGSKTIRTCLEQLDKQTFKGKYEVLVVDDKSTDESVTVVKNMIKTFLHAQEFKVIESLENGRAGAARNLGVKNAKGEYILFVDQDDYPDSRMLETLYELTQEGKIECTACDIHDKDGSQYSRVYLGTKDALEDEDRRALMRKHGYSFAILIKKDVIEKNHIFFPEKVMYEDVLFGCGLYACIQSFANTDEKLYWRDDDEQSQTFTMTKPKMVDRVKAAKWYIENYLGNASIRNWQAELHMAAFYYIYLSCTWWMICRRELFDYKMLLQNIAYVRAFHLSPREIWKNESRYSGIKLLILLVIYEIPLLIYPTHSVMMFLKQLKKFLGRVIDKKG